MATVTWTSPTDWDNAIAEDNVVHESVTNTEHDDAGDVRKGSSYSSPPQSGSLQILIPCHEASGTIHDVWGSNDESSKSGGPTQGVSGRVGGKAVSLDGTDDVVTFGNAPSAFDGNTVTMSCWVNVPSNNIGQIMGAGDGSSEQFAVKRVGDGRYEVFGRDSSGFFNPRSSSASTGWVWLVVSYNSGTVRLWEDGTSLINTSTGGSNLGNNGSNFRIGNRGNSNFLQATVCEIYVWNGVHSPATLADLEDMVTDNGTLTTAAKAS